MDLYRPGLDCGSHLRMRCGDAVTNADTHPCCHRDARSDSNTHSHVHSYRDPNSTPDGDTGTNPHRHCDGHTHPHRHRNAYPPPDGNAYSHASAQSHARDHRPIGRGTPH